jgi:3-hydroxyisobutyrate dehydrogenase
MGVGMSRNLHKRGLLHAVWNRTQSRSAQLAQELGILAASSAAEIASECNCIVLCIAADQDVLEVIAAIAPRVQRGSLVIDCSTVSADTAKIAARILAEQGVDFLDAPVSGGVEGANKGTLAIMVGGEEKVFNAAKPVLDAMGATVTHFGPTGSGQAAKATNQIMCAGIMQAVSEAMAFAQAEGLPLDKLIDTLGKGAGSSWYFVNRAPNIVRGTYPPGFRVRLHAKDLRICHDMAERFGVQLPIVEMTLVHYRRLIEQGHGDEDISTLFRLKEALFDKRAGSA